MDDGRTGRWLQMDMFDSKTPGEEAEGNEGNLQNLWLCPNLGRIAPNLETEVIFANRSLYSTMQRTVADSAMPTASKEGC